VLDTLSDEPEETYYKENLRECPRPRDQQPYARNGNIRSAEKRHISKAKPNHCKHYSNRNQQSVEHAYNESLHAATPSALASNNPTNSSKLQT